MRLVIYVFSFLIWFWVTARWGLAIKKAYKVLLHLFTSPPYNHNHLTNELNIEILYFSNLSSLFLVVSLANMNFGVLLRIKLVVRRNLIFRKRVSGCFWVSTEMTLRGLWIPLEINEADLIVVYWDILHYRELFWILRRDDCFCIFEPL